MPIPTIFQGDCIEVMRLLPPNSISSIVCDPPYGLGFMGKAWDDLPPGLPWAQECLRVLKPGGHLLAFGGTRTWHRLACAIEDAGFEMRDSIAWLYGSGFPKSHNVSNSIRGGLDEPETPESVRWQGWGTALKPAFEPVVVARKPLVGTVAQNVLAYGTGAINVDAGRSNGESNRPYPANRSNRFLLDGCTSVEDLRERAERDEKTPTGRSATATLARYLAATGTGAQDAPAGRWPANVALDSDSAAELDQQSGTGVSRKGKLRGAASGEGWGMTATGAEYDDQGGASRFFYVAKAPKSERPVVDGIAHPTVKPLSLMRWLVRMFTPPGGLVLDPFAGSGTTVEAALLEGFDVVGIERDGTYLPLIQARIDRQQAKAETSEDAS